MVRDKKEKLVLIKENAKIQPNDQNVAKNKGGEEGEKNCNQILIFLCQQMMLVEPTKNPVRNRVLNLECAFDRTQQQQQQVRT